MKHLLAAVLFVLCCLWTPVLHASCPAGQIAVGDRDDSDLMREAIWFKGAYPDARRAGLDFNDDRLVDRKDYLELQRHLKDGKPPFCRKAPVVPPVLSRRSPVRHFFDVGFTPHHKSLARLCEELTQVQTEDLEQRHDPAGGVLARKAILLTEEIDKVTGPGNPDACPGFQLAKEMLPVWRAAATEWSEDRPAGRAYLEACAVRQDGESAVVQEDSLGSAEWCSVNGISLPMFMQPYSYRIRSVNKRMKIELPLHYTLAPNIPASEVSGVVSRWKDALECAQDFWSRYGVTLEFQHDDDAVATFELHAGDGRADSGTLYTGRTRQHLCGTVIHELGHHFGLNDEYDGTADDCPGRPVGEEDGVMSEHRFLTKYQARGLKELRWYPRNLEKVFRPLCGKI